MVRPKQRCILRYTTNCEPNAAPAAKGLAHALARLALLYQQYIFVDGVDMSVLQGR